ncbi:hypothetical protein ACT29H_09310 [Thermophagus sp. OGC60D27]|uniref:hypothetical protein n=1 Tax=Thermophagus sp. OGC60D27 TaxID=3458415 RepID=UPI0040380FC3
MTQSKFTIKLMGTYEEVQMVTAKIESVWGVENIDSISGIFPSKQLPNQKHMRPYHRYISLDPGAPISITDINGNKVQSAISKLFRKHGD